MIANAIQDNLCYRFRSQGLPKELVHNILNVIAKWVNNSGVEWTVDRLKAIHHYYIEFNANQKTLKEFLDEKRPEYIGIRKDGLPKGIFKTIFKIHNMKTALNILSCHADFVNERLTDKQYKKFIDGISTETNISLDLFRDKDINMLFVKTNKQFRLNTGYFTSLKRIGLVFDQQELDDLKKHSKYIFKAINTNSDYSNCIDLPVEDTNIKLYTYRSNLYIRKDYFPDFSIITTKSIPAFDDIWTYRDNIHIKEVQDLFKKSLPIDDINKPLNLDIPSKLVTSKRQRIYRVNSNTDVAVAYAYSWYCVPKLTIDYIGEQYGWLYLPDGLLHNEIHELTHTDGLSLTLNQRMNLVGTIGIIQEKSLKARVVANPNKVTQFYLKPLGSKLYELLRSVSTDCTYDQESGSIWCQEMLNNNIVLSAVDLSSATDTLSVEASFKLIEKFFFQKDFDSKDDNSNLDPSWVKGRNHFLSLCKNGLWSVIDPEGKEQFVSYKQGQPMGTFPSFALLGLTNNIVASYAAIKNGYLPEESFRVIGDDIVMRQEIASTYIQLITSIGGQVNNFKTVTSSLLTEFAGGIITKNLNIRKTSKSINLDDNNFMSKVKSFGYKLIPFLKPKQKRIFKSKAMYIPGVAIDGPWSNDSYGIPLDLRLDYAFTLASKLEQRVKPDQRFLDSEQFANYLYWSLKSKDRENLMAFCCPSTLYEDFQSSTFFEYASMHFDQIENGKTLLDSLSSKDLPTFNSFLKEKLNKEMDNVLDNLPKVKNIRSYCNIDISSLIKQVNKVNPSEDLLPFDTIIGDINTLDQAVKQIDISKDTFHKCVTSFEDICELFGSSPSDFNKYLSSQTLDWLLNYKEQTVTRNLSQHYFNKYSEYLLHEVSCNTDPLSLVKCLYDLLDGKDDDMSINKFYKYKLFILYTCTLIFDFEKRPYYDFKDFITTSKYCDDFTYAVFNDIRFNKHKDTIRQLDKKLIEFIDNNKFLKNFNWSRLILGTSFWGKQSLPLTDRFDAQYLEKKFTYSKTKPKLKSYKYDSMGHSL